MLLRRAHKPGSVKALGLSASNTHHRCAEQSQHALIDRVCHSVFSGNAVGFTEIERFYEHFLLLLF